MIFRGSFGSSAVLIAVALVLCAANLVLSSILLSRIGQTKCSMVYAASKSRPTDTLKKEETTPTSDPVTGVQGIPGSKLEWRCIGMDKKKGPVSGYPTPTSRTSSAKEGEEVTEVIRDMTVRLLDDGRVILEKAIGDPNSRIPAEEVGRTSLKEIEIGTMSIGVPINRWLIMNDQLIEQILDVTKGLREWESLTAEARQAVHNRLQSTYVELLRTALEHGLTPEYVGQERRRLIQNLEAFLPFKRKSVSQD